MDKTIRYYFILLLIPITFCFFSSDITFAGLHQWTNTGLTNTYINALAIDPVTPDTIYAGGLDGVFKSINNGDSWTAINTGLTNTDVDNGPASVNALAIDPVDTSTVYAGTAYGVFKSIDNGDSWTAINTGLTNTYVESGTASVNALAIDPVNTSTIYAGTNSSGVFKSTDGGDNWKGTPLFSGLIKTLAIDPIIPSTIFAGARGNGVYKSDDSGFGWLANSTIRKINTLAIDPVNTTIYAGTEFSTTDGDIIWPGGVFKSTDGGDDWIDNWAPSSLTFNTVETLAIDPNIPSTIYAGTRSNGVYKSADGGKYWTKINTGLDLNYGIWAISVNPVTSTTIYAGTSIGVFKYTFQFTRVPFYRLYNPNNGEHHYTQSLHEYEFLDPIGWVQESIAYYIYNGINEIDSVNSQPLYRVFNPNSSLHHWTLDQNEYDTLGSTGWTKEGIAGYIFQEQVTGSDPLYRLYNPNDGNHHWTMDENEKNTIVTFGWKDEGIAGYVFAPEN